AACARIARPQSALGRQAPRCGPGSGQRLRRRGPARLPARGRGGRGLGRGEQAGRKGGPRFDAVVLISGLYDLRTETLKGPARVVAPALNFVYRGILGLAGERERHEASPAALVRSGQQGRLDAGCPWWVLSARRELLGLWPLEDAVFGCSDFVDGLAAKGADVRRAECGYNHWLLVFSFDAFARSFCGSL
ncbi:unnamed protein product, partial [Prorocentrum cordatum]